MENPHGYRGVLLMLMKHRDGCEYEEGHVFSREVLGAITAQDVLDWVNVKTFGKMNPSLDDRPTFARANSIQFWKSGVTDATVEFYVLSTVTSRR